MGTISADLAESGTRKNALALPYCRNFAESQADSRLSEKANLKIGPVFKNHQTFFLLSFET